MPAPPPLSEPATVSAIAVALLRFTQPPSWILLAGSGIATQVEPSETGKDAAVDFRGFVRSAEDFDKFESKLHRGTRSLAGNNRAINHDAFIGNLFCARHDLGSNSGMTGGHTILQNTESRKNGRRGANGSEITILRPQCFNDLTDAHVLAKVRRAGLAARQDEHVEIVRVDIIERAVRNVFGLPRSLNWTGPSSCNSHFNTRPPQDIDDGNRLDLFEAGRQRNKHPLHRGVAAGGLVASAEADGGGSMSSEGVRALMRWATAAPFSSTLKRKAITSPTFSLSTVIFSLSRKI